MMLVATVSASSRGLLTRGCRRACWLSLDQTSCAVKLNHEDKYHVTRCVESNHFHRRIPSFLLFSTLPFDHEVYSNDLLSPDDSGVDLADPQLSQKPTFRLEISKNSSINQKFRQQIQHWMSTNSKTAPYKAEKSLADLWMKQQDLFQQWEEQREQASSASSPTILLSTESVNLVIQAWRYSNGGEVAAERAERLLRWMEEFHSSGPIPEESLDSTLSRLARLPFLPKPNYQSYGTVIDAWSRAAACESRNPTPPQSRGSSYHISDATSAGFECAKRAEILLMNMQQMHERRLRMAGEGRIGESYNAELQPDTRVFNLVLRAWATIQGGTKASAIRATRILDLMQELHHRQSKGAFEWQGRTLSQVQPNLQTYKAVINAWAHATHTVEGPDRAEEILRHLLSLSKAGNLGVEIMPDAECFHIVMKAHAEEVRKRRKGDDGSASVERAQKITSLLDWMELMALRSSVEPTSETYRVALSAWAWSHHVEAPKKAEGILNQMIRACDMNRRWAAKDKDADAEPMSDSWTVRPETRDFNTVINCCSFARQVGVDSRTQDDESLLQRQLAHQEIFDIAEGVLQSLLASPYCQANEATFMGIIRAANNLLPNTDDRDKRVIELFRLAYHTSTLEAPSSAVRSPSFIGSHSSLGAGCVGVKVLRQLRHALPTSVYIRAREEFETYRRRRDREA